jgi:WD40 repeat protein
MITAGYDSTVRLWDLRKKSPCTAAWDDPDDYAAYCVRHDWNWKVVSGTAYHGTLRIWDERMGRCLQTLFVDLARRSQGVVYSVDFDDSAMYVALSNGLQMIDFL